MSPLPLALDNASDVLGAIVTCAVSVHVVPRGSVCTPVAGFSFPHQSVPRDRPCECGGAIAAAGGGSMPTASFTSSVNSK